jgi:hypothetical protein
MSHNITSQNVKNGKKLNVTNWNLPSIKSSTILTVALCDARLQRHGPHSIKNFKRLFNSFVRIVSGGCDWWYVGSVRVRTVEAEGRAYLMRSMRWDPPGAKLRLNPTSRTQHLCVVRSMGVGCITHGPHHPCLTNSMFFALCDVYVLKIWRIVMFYVMWCWLFETLTYFVVFTFWNYYFLKLLCIVMLR